jgi:hypothetical protein
MGGKLLLTKDQLSFVPGSLNFRKPEHSITLGDIVSIQAKHSELISNRFTLLLRNGSVEEFRVPKRKEWLKTLEEALKEKKAAGANWRSGSSEFSRAKKSVKWYLRVAIKVFFIAVCVCVLAFIFQTFFFIW